jgi:hypothetical protein
LPETLDVSEFPYLIFAKGDNNIIILHAFTEKVYMTADHFLTAGVEGKLRRFALENDSYEQLADLPYSGGEKIFMSKFSGIFWSNWDIQYPIGGIYFYGSKPIPTSSWITNRLTIDLAEKTNVNKIYATQNEKNARTLIVNLMENGNKFILPENVSILLHCYRQDGNSFVNSQLDNGKDAFRITDNVISYILPYELFVSPGLAEINFVVKKTVNDVSYRLNTFNVMVEIDEDPLLKGISNEVKPA